MACAFRANGSVIPIGTVRTDPTNATARVISISHLTKRQIFIIFSFFLFSFFLFFFFELWNPLPSGLLQPAGDEAEVSKALSEAAPETESNPEKCPLGELLCISDGACIRFEQLCDGTNDCADGADETDCGTNDAPDDVWCNLVAPYGRVQHSTPLPILCPLSTPALLYKWVPVSSSGRVSHHARQFPFESWNSAARRRSRSIIIPTKLFPTFLPVSI